MSEPGGRFPQVSARDAAFWAACFAAPVALLALACAAGGVYPFGPESFLTEDEKYQYVDLFMWFRGVLLGQASPFYLANTGLGANAWGIVSYYLGSPFNLLLVFFDEERIALFFWVVTALKLGCAQVSCAWYVRRRFGASRAAAFALALGFAFSSWTVAQMRNPQWLDVLIVLPLAAWALHQLVRRGRWMPLSVAVAVQVAVCWYMAYMLVLFLCLLFVVELAAAADDGCALPLRTVGLRVVRFAVALAGALVLAAFTFVPTVWAMLGGFGGDHYPFPLINENRWQVAAGLFAGGWVLDFVPEHFAGMFVLVCAGAFALAPQVRPRTKAAALATAVLLVLSCNQTAWLEVWCGLRMPQGFFCRISYLGVFMLVWMAGRGLAALREEGAPRWVLPASCGLTVAAIAAVAAHGAFAQAEAAAVEAAAVAAFGVLVWLNVYDKQHLRRTSVAGAGACVLAACELLYGAHAMLPVLYAGYGEAYHEAYVAEARDLYAELRAADAGLYRVDKTYTRVDYCALNEALSRGYLALSTYASSQDFAAVVMLEQLGYSIEGQFSVAYAEPQVGADALLGVKYVSADERPAGYVDDGFSRTRAAAMAQGAAFYRNPYALPLGYLVDDGAAGFLLDADANPFERQNALCSALLGRDVRLYRPIEADETRQLDGRLLYRFTVPAGQVGYVYSYTDDPFFEMDLVIDGGEPLLDHDRWHHAVTQVADAAAVDAEHELLLCSHWDFDGEVDHLEPGSRCIFYALDLEALAAATDELAAHPLDFEAFESGHIVAEVEAPADGWALVSMPAADGWRVRVNGRAADVAPVCDGALTLVPVAAGANRIEMDFASPGALPGALLSAGGIISYVLLAVRKRRAERGTA